MRLTFTKITVADLDRQAAFYAAVVGQVARHRLSRGESEEIVMGPADGDGPSLLLLRDPDREVPPPGEAVLGFAVTDVDEAVRAARAAGGVVRSGPTSLPDHAVRVAAIEDPEGHRVEIVQQL